MSDFDTDPPKKKRVYRPKVVHEDEEEDRPSRREGRGFQCPFCKSRKLPVYDSKISGSGWVVFVLLLLFCFPFCFFGLMMREEAQYCQDCDMKLG